ncbi:cytochrome c1-like [Frankliniella occidentalis]|uniref:Cytochrome c1-like n=1 Tax=Frankliniella occidentalis TaxID=133901 RepID=A0A9C6X6N1_FRAOC|nr:cytochrome c1-like [Frankliniella occidentalis]
MEPLILSQESQDSRFDLQLHPSGLLYDESSCEPPIGEDAPVSEAPASEAPASEAPASEAPASVAPASVPPASEAPGEEAAADEEGCKKPTPHPLSLPDLLSDEACDGFVDEVVSTASGRRRVAHKRAESVAEPPGISALSPRRLGPKTKFDPAQEAVAMAPYTPRAETRATAQPQPAGHRSVQPSDPTVDRARQQAPKAHPS